jgi:hypothetical protein
MASSFVAVEGGFGLLSWFEQERGETIVRFAFVVGATNVGFTPDNVTRAPATPAAKARHRLQKRRRRPGAFAEGTRRDPGAAPPGRGTLTDFLRTRTTTPDVKLAAAWAAWLDNHSGQRGRFASARLMADAFCNVQRAIGPAVRLLRCPRQNG